MLKVTGDETFLASFNYFSVKAHKSSDDAEARLPCARGFLSSPPDKLFVCLIWSLELSAITMKSFFYRNPHERDPRNYNKRDLTEIKGGFIFEKVQWAPKNLYGLCLEFQKQSYYSHFRALPDYFSKSELPGFRTFLILNPLIDLFIVIWQKIGHPTQYPIWLQLFKKGQTSW